MSSNRTNANGECTIKGVSKGEHTLTASKTGYRTVKKDINVDGSELNVNIELDKDGGQGFDVHMTVVDEQKQPIQGATVELDGDTRTTGSAGGCNFQNISEGKHTLIASKTGYSTVKKDINVDGSQLDFLITLNKEETGTKNITFQLKDEYGNNISLYNGTNLELLDPDKPASAAYTGPINENGQATINDIKIGSYALSLPAIPDEYRGLDEEPFNVTIDTSENVELKVPFNLSDITYKVTDRKTGKVIQGATIKFGDLTGTTDDKGVYTFKDLPRGDYSLGISHKFYHERNGLIPVRRTTTEEEELDRTTHSVSIHVHDGDVNIQDASVTLNNTTETTDVNGNCAFMDILADEYPVKVSANGYETKNENVEFYEEHITADIVLEVNTTNVTVEVKESGGATRVQGAIVNLNNENKTTDEKGKCTFEKVQYGDHPLRIFKEGYKTIVTNINVHKDMSVWAEEKLRVGDSITLTAKNKPVYEGESLEITGQLNGQTSGTKVMNFQIGTRPPKGGIIDNNRAVYKYLAHNDGLIPVTAQYNGEVESNVLYIHDGDLPRTNVIIKPIDEVTKEPLHYTTSWLINQDGWEIEGDYQKGGTEDDTVTIENVICGNYNLKVHHGEHKEKIIPLVVEKDMGITTVELTPNSNENKGE